MSLRLFVFAIFITLIGLTTVGLCADSSSSDQIMLAEIPFSYGEEKFVERVLAHSKGREPVGLVLSGGSARAFAVITSYSIHYTKLYDGLDNFRNLVRRKTGPVKQSHNRTH